MNEILLTVRDLSVSFDTYAGEVQAVRGVGFEVRAGEIVAIVGESGSGKSVMTQSLVKLLPSPPARIKSGSVVYRGKELTGLSFKRMREIKGKEIAYIFQDPLTCLNPTLKIGRQVTEALRAHSKITKARAWEKAAVLLRDAGIPNPERRLEQYPYEMSGGMRQRVMIAIAIAMSPKLLVADEPTTALDVTIQSQILGTLKKINRETGMALILITHDMGIVASMARRVIVMYGGRIVESGEVRDIFYRALHPYTRSLLAAVPRLDTQTDKPLEYIVGSPPDMLNPPPGCPFAPRCRFSMEICYRKTPETHTERRGHACDCHLYLEGAKARLEEFKRAYPDLPGEEASQ